MSVKPTGPEERYFLPTSASYQDLPEARAAYKDSISYSQEHHAEVGILSSAGEIIHTRLGKNEEYGSHRVGSVTKTFTTFLALKFAKEGILPNGLSTRCKELLPKDIFVKLFEDPEAAENMTLEQLLSHTAGLELDDHCREGTAPSSTMHERFLKESTEGYKFKHTSKPGDKIGSYSNAGYAVAGWMLEAAYNKHHEKSTPESFAQIMKREIFEEVFGLSDSFIGPPPNGDIIQVAAGGMTSSINDLMKVALRLSKGEDFLESVFGSRWQSTMLSPQDLLENYGLGCSPKVTYIQHAGMTRERFIDEERDTTALVIFPLRPGEPGLAAMCDSRALGPAPQERKFIQALKKSAGISVADQKQQEPVYDLDFFCPDSPNILLFHGDAYLVTNTDPFALNSPEKIICSINGMKHLLTREISLDKENICAYQDENKKTWLVISRADGRKTIYSEYCLVTETIESANLALSQPDAASVKSLIGTYQNAENPNKHPTYFFTEKHGHLYMRESDNQYSYPCLYIPDADRNGGVWVVSNPSGRKIQFRFPGNPDENFLIITDILTGVPQLPEKSIRIHP